MLNVRLSAREHEKLAELVDELGVSQSGLIRQWIRSEHARVFGPPTPPKPRRKRQ